MSKATNPVPPAGQTIRTARGGVGAQREGRGVLTNAGLEGIPDNERRASGIPLPPKWRPGKLFGVRESAIELRTCLGDCTYAH